MNVSIFTKIFIYLFDIIILQMLWTIFITFTKINDFINTFFYLFEIIILQNLWTNFITFTKNNDLINTFFYKLFELLLSIKVSVLFGSLLYSII